MAEPMTRTQDFPNFDTYPGTVASPERSLPSGTRVDELLIDTAESIGGALGSAVHRVSELQQLLEKQFDMIQERTRSIQGRTREIASAKVASFRNAAEPRVVDVKGATHVNVAEL